MNKKKVAIITNIPAPYRVDLFNYLQSNYSEFDFIIIYSSKSEDNRQWKVDKSKIINSIFLKSYTIKIKKSNDNKYIHIPYNAISVLNRINPDIIVGSEYNPTIIQALMWCKLRRKKFVSWSDGTLNSEKNINFIQKLVRRLIIKGASSYIASSTRTKEAQCYYGAKKNNIFISYLTIDIEKNIYKRKGSNNYNLLYVGSLIKRKGVDLLIDALSNVNENYKLTIVGDGPEKERLIKQATRLNIIDKIDFVGFKHEDDLKKYYIKSDIFILPTREDCFGLVTLEAICAEMPVIVSKYADGATDLVKDGESGIIIDPYNKDEVARAIERMITDSKLREKMQKKSKDIIEKFSFKSTSKEFINAIDYANR